MWTTILIIYWDFNLTSKNLKHLKDSTPTALHEGYSYPDKEVSTWYKIRTGLVARFSPNLF